MLPRVFIAQHLQERAQQSRFAVLIALPGDQHGVVQRQQRLQIIVLAHGMGGARWQIKAAAHRIVEPTPAVRSTRQMVGIAAQ